MEKMDDRWNPTSIHGEESIKTTCNQTNVSVDKTVVVYSERRHCYIFQEVRRKYALDGSEDHEEEEEESLGNDFRDFKGQFGFINQDCFILALQSNNTNSKIVIF